MCAETRRHKATRHYTLKHNYDLPSLSLHLAEYFCYTTVVDSRDQHWPWQMWRYASQTVRRLWTVADLFQLKHIGLKFIMASVC